MSDPRRQAHTQSQRVKAAQLARMETICSEPYLEGFVRPWLEGDATATGPWSTKVMQLDGSGAATVRIALDDGPPVYAKAFPFEDGPEVYAKLRVFRLTGFGEGQRYQTVEPLAWDEELSVLLCREAPGPAVGDLIGARSAALEAATAEAGRWLGTFHAADLRVGRPSSLLVTGELTSLAKRLSKTTAERPSYLPVALEMLAALDDLTYTVADGIVTQTHGQYRPIHVFTTAGRTTVIDLDRSSPGDPARDVAEFLHHLRSSAFVVTGDRHSADQACHTFLAGYQEVARPDYMTNLRFHWARYVMHSLSRQVKSGDVTTEDIEHDPTYLRYRAEFDRIVDGSLLS